MSVDLKDAIDASYLDNEGAEKHLRGYGYNLDHLLSDHESKVFYHPQQDKLIISYRGTSNLDDIKTDGSLAIGKLKETDRYNRSKKTYDEAKKKYNKKEATITGHSLGGSLASAIGNDDDFIHTYNKGRNLSNETKNKKNEKSYKTNHDVVSILDNQAQIIPNKNSYYGFSYFVPSFLKPLKVVDDHGTHNLRDRNIFV